MRLRATYPAACAALTLAAALCGCANPALFDHGEHWFSRPLDVTGRASGYTFSELQESRDKARPAPAGELVSSNGACPPPASPGPAGAPAAGPGSAPATPGAGGSAADAAQSLLGAGVALGMSECEVVWRVGAPSSVQLGNNPNGDRTALLTFASGPQAGVYRFQRGRLRAMDRAEAAAAPRSKVAKRVRREPAEQISTE